MADWDIFAAAILAVSGIGAIVTAWWMVIIPAPPLPRQFVPPVFDAPYGDRQPMSHTVWGDMLRRQYEDELAAEKEIPIDLGAIVAHLGECDRNIRFSPEGTILDPEGVRDADEGEAVGSSERERSGPTHGGFDIECD